MLPFSIPPSASASRTLKAGSRGLDVYALQTALNDWLKERNQSTIVADGIFGAQKNTSERQTERAVLRFQGHNGLTEDGLAGQKTQLALVVAVAAQAQSATGMPPGLVKGLVLNESLGYLGAVNDSVAGGKDLSAWQKRVKTASLDDWKVVGLAYDMRYMASKVTGDFRKLYDSISAPEDGLEDFGVHAGVRGRWELTTLSHNFPAAVLHLARGVREWRFIEHDVIRYADDRPVPGQPNLVSRLTGRPARWIKEASGGRLSYTYQWTSAYIKNATRFVEWA